MREKGDQRLAENKDALIRELNKMRRQYFCLPCYFAALRSGQAVFVPVRAERNPKGEVEA